MTERKKMKHEQIEGSIESRSRFQLIHMTCTVSADSQLHNGSTVWDFLTRMTEHASHIRLSQPIAMMCLICRSLSNIILIGQRRETKPVHIKLTFCVYEQNVMWERNEELHTYKTCEQ